MHARRKNKIISILVSEAGVLGKAPPQRFCLRHIVKLPKGLGQGVVNTVFVFIYFTLKLFQDFV